MRSKTPEEEYLSLVCGYCGNNVHMPVVARYSQIVQYDDEKSGMSWEAGPVWRLVLCPACHRVGLTRMDYHEYFDPEEWSLEMVYPRRDERRIADLPDHVRKEYEATLTVRNLSPNAYGTLLGRTIDAVCSDRGAEGKTLSERLRNLAEKEGFPKTLSEMFDKLRSLRNVAAHFDLGELTEDEVPVLDSLCRAVLEYVYVAPRLIDKAQAALQKVRRT